MSVIVPLSCLSIEKQKQLKKELTLIPTPSAFLKAKKHIAQKEPIIFYLFDGTFVLIPYYYATYFLNTPSYELSYLPHPVLPFSFMGELRDYQKPVAEECLGHLSAFGTTTLNVYPSFGKTVVCSYLTSRIGLLTLILMHITDLLEQWANTFKTYTNAKYWIVDMEDYSKAPLEMFTGLNVIICMDGRIDKLPPLLLDQVGLLIVDEAHAFCTPSRVSCLLKTHPRYVISNTATLEREDQMETMMMNLCGPHKIYIPSTKEHQVVKLNTGIQIEMPIKDDKSVDWAAYSHYYSQNPLRIWLILYLCEMFSDRKILILTSERKPAENLHKMLCLMGKNCSLMIGGKKTYHDCQILVGTIKKIGTGFDEKSGCVDFGGFRLNLLILTHSIKGTASLEQCVGRIFRSDEPMVVDMVDDNNIARSHWEGKWNKEIKKREEGRKEWYINAHGSIREESLDLSLVMAWAERWMSVVNF